MDSWTDPDAEMVVLMSASQVGKTEILLNIIAYHVEHEPCPLLAVEPTNANAETLSKDRVSPMIQAMSGLRERIAPPRSKNSENTILHKRFAGGHLTLTGTNTATNLAMRPIRAVLLDEVDRYPEDVNSEGDPVRLALKRSNTYQNRRHYMCSSPTFKGRSRIESAYEETDQRRYFLPCHACGETQVLYWRHVVWDKDAGGRSDATTARIQCEACGARWNEAQRRAAVLAGEWRPTARAANPKKRGYHLNELATLFRRLEEIVQDWLDCQGKPKELQAFTNTVLAETWEEEGTSLEPSELYRRRERYAAEVPADVLIITGAFDVQDDRIEFLAVGWGENEEAWPIDHRVLWGNPDGPELWERAAELLNNRYVSELGDHMGIVSAAVDTGGHHTQRAYKFKKRCGSRVWALKGMPGEARDLVGRPSKRNKEKVALFPVGVDPIKAIIYGRLGLGYDAVAQIHLPVADFCDEEFCAQLVAERATKRYVKGFSHVDWVKIRARNEILDLFVYAYASIIRLNVSWKHRRAERDRVKNRQPAKQSNRAAASRFERSTL